MDLLPEHENNSDIQQSVQTRTIKDLPEVLLILYVLYKKYSVFANFKVCNTLVVCAFYPRS